jgi:hypothetical protein
MYSREENKWQVKVEAAHVEIQIEKKVKQLQRKWDNRGDEKKSSQIVSSCCS